MKKKKKFIFKLYKPKFLTVLIIGITLGVISQYIPQIKAQTSEFIHSLEDREIYSSTSDIYQTNSISKNLPISSFQIDRQGYSLAYDARTRNPIWVYEHLTADNLKGNIKRIHFDFKEDEKIPKILRATLADYKNQGFDRGHLAPAADHQLNSETMSDTFYLTNMCPQCPQFNRGYWSKFERHVRDLTKKYKHVHVITGPLYVPYTDLDGNRYIKYKVIGKNDVSVPTHFFKIITLDNETNILETRAYMLPNEEIASNVLLDSFKTTVEKIEKLAGFILIKE